MVKKNDSQKIILLHGWGAEAPHNIEPLAEELRGKGYEVIQPHLPGFGESENPPQPWFVKDYVSWVIDQMDERSWQSATICGHSFGGRIGIKLATKYSDRIDKLVLIASAGIKHELSVKAKVVRAIGSVGRAVFAIPGLNMIEPIVYSFWRKILGRKDYYKVSGVMQETFINVVEEDLRPMIPNISIPTLILWGQKDALVPLSDAHFINDAVSNSRLKIYSQGDHKIPYDYPKEIAEEIDFFIKEED